MKIYTRKGDRGTTAVLGGGRLSKADPRIRALGALDETNAVLGAARAQTGLPSELRPILHRIQETLLEAGAALASNESTAGAETLRDEVTWLEEQIDSMEERLEPLSQFILPGGGAPGAHLHWARSVARRAESLTVEAVGTEPGRLALLAWLNRLSDALFVLARFANHLSGEAEPGWTSRQKKARGNGPGRTKGGAQAANDR